MKEIYEITAPIYHPSPPDKWSYSSLSLFKKCMKRWWLTNSKYSNSQEGKYPAPSSIAIFHGNIIHTLLDKFNTHVKQVIDNSSDYTKVLQGFSIRKTIHTELQRLLNKENRTNPRTSIDYITSGIDLNYCINQFKTIIASVDFQKPSTQSTPSVSTKPNNNRTGGKRWIEINDPPICGKLDLVSRQDIIEYKTGKEEEGHIQQILFYAYLWWKKHSTLPDSLIIIYTKTKIIKEIPLPTEAELNQYEKELRENITIYTSKIIHKEISVSPDRTTCEHCSVKQLCNEYWNSDQTDILRENKGIEFDYFQEATWTDAEIQSLPPEWTPGKPLIGKAMTKNLELTIQIDNQKCPTDTTRKPTSARILGGLLEIKNGEWFLSSKTNTEVFWKYSK